MNIRRIWIVGALLISMEAAAGLGDAPTQAPAIAAQSGGAKAKGVQPPAANPTALGSYTINAVPAAGGGTIKEYVSTQGIVFAISWRTPMMPNLQRLLGASFPAFEQAAIASRSQGRRGPLNIERADLVLQSSGQLGDFRGRAFVPGLLPPDVASEAIQ